MSAALLADIEELFREVVDLEGVAFSGPSVLGRDIPVDSKDMLRVLSRIEAKYRFRFRPDQILRLGTVDDLVSAVLEAAPGGRSSGGRS
jgi:acyl carrier protein